LFQQGGGSDDRGGAGVAARVLLDALSQSQAVEAVIGTADGETLSVWILPCHRGDVGGPVWWTRLVLMRCFSAGGC
jgi:hypothetical protein